jgi:N-acetyl-gamma-glutamyl-phosphate reductase
MNAVVIGAAGYVGGELLRILHLHPEVNSWTAVSRSQADKPVGEVHPALAGLSDARFSGASPAEAAQGADVLFLALEHGESSRLAAEVFSAQPKLVIDLAADFRVSDLSLHEKYYGPHADPESVSRFSYALADVKGKTLLGKNALAAPGCFATAAQLALYPLAKLAFNGAPSLFAVTGSSGSGVHPKATTHHPARANNLFAYSVLGHRHEAEVLQQWRSWHGPDEAAPRLMTHSGPFVRGIYLTLHAQLQKATDVAVLFKNAYEGRPFVRLLKEPPQLTQAVGTNFALIHVAQNPEQTEVQVMIAIDNLVKGAGGQAVQAMNLALGLPETAGLLTPGFFPC